LSSRQIGIEPSLPMLKWSPTVAPQADFICGKAESLPVTSNSVDLITAAGSLNWVDLPSFFPEAERVLRPNGLMVIYDFSPGREFSKSNRLSNWFSEFEKRYPVPSCREISPDTLQKESYGFRLSSHEYFEISLQLSPEFYLEYILTETNVVFAINNGIRGQEIRSWCQETLEPVFQKSTQVVVFRGFMAFLYR